jgi:hypothetical protein
VSNLASAASNINDAEARIRRMQERIRTPQAKAAPARAAAPARPSPLAAPPATATTAKASSPRQLPHGLVPPNFASPVPPPAPAAATPRLTPPELRRVAADANGCSPVSPALTPPPVWTPTAAAPRHGASTATGSRGTWTRTETSSQHHHWQDARPAEIVSRNGLVDVSRAPLQTPPPSWTPGATREHFHQTPYSDRPRHSAPGSAVRATPLRWDEDDSPAADGTHTGSIGGALMQHAASVAARRRGGTSTSTRESRMQPARASPSVRASPLSDRTPNGSMATSRSTAHRHGVRQKPASSGEDLRELNPRNVKLLLETVEQLLQRKCNLNDNVESLRQRVAAFANAQHADTNDYGSLRGGGRGLAEVGA